MTLTLTILGCASSAGVPRVGGTTHEERWGACDPNNTKNHRRRCSVLLTKTGPGGSTYCVIDTGPDFRAQMLEAKVPRLDGVVYTHEHADHLHGIDDMRPFALIQRARIPGVHG
jgi:phosphoribosyl 1,2-cyclic phosphate phosphodiesterase